MSARPHFSLLKLFGIATLASFGLLSLLYLGLIPHLLYLRGHPPQQTSLMRGTKHPISHQWVPLHEISPLLQKAVIAQEDFNFYHHHGFDLEELKRSLKKNLREGRFARGGSTITMQLAKNLYLWREKTFLRKFLEAVITIELEQFLTKQRILELYLNVIEWGPGIYGAEAAAHHYFKRSAASLSPEEAVTLTSLIPNPILLSQPRYQHYVERRKKWLLYRIGVRGEAPPLKLGDEYIPEEDLPGEETPLESEPEPLPLEEEAGLE